LNRLYFEEGSRDCRFMGVIRNRNDRMMKICVELVESKRIQILRIKMSRVTVSVW
jgi:hypothetical protein